MRDFLSKWGPPVPAEVGDVRFPDFEQQCEAFLDAEPLVVSSIMGLFPAGFVRRLKDRGIAWFACVTTLAEAREAERAGADAVVPRDRRRADPGCQRRTDRDGFLEMPGSSDQCCLGRCAQTTDLRARRALTQLGQGADYRLELRRRRFADRRRWGIAAWSGRPPVGSSSA